MKHTRFFLVLALALTAFAAKVTYSYDANGRLASATYSGGLVIAYTYDPAGNLLNRTVGTVAAGAATITSVNTAGAGPDIAQNDWIEIKGNNLTPADTPAAGVIWSTAPEFASGKMPTQIGGVSVTVNGKPAFVYYYCSAVTSHCASDQVNVLTPLDSTVGPVNIVVTSAAGASAPYIVNLKSIAPSFLLFSPPYVVAVHADYSLIGPPTLYPGLSTPAKPNELVTLYAVGFGLPAAALTNGSSSQSGPLAPLPVCTVGSNPAAVSFAGLVSPGLYQINLTIPANTGNSDQTIGCTYNGASTPATDMITVHQ
jgi:uncharacterized protein (TIGR03437 family)